MTLRCCLLFVIVPFIATSVLCRERNLPLYDSTPWVSLAFILSIKKDNYEEQLRPQGGLLNWTHFKGGSQSCQNFDFLIPKEAIIRLAAWSTGVDMKLHLPDLWRQSLREASAFKLSTHKLSLLPEAWNHLSDEERNITPPSREV